jgi:hypothetical protein
VNKRPIIYVELKPFFLSLIKKIPRHESTKNVGVELHGISNPATRRVVSTVSSNSVYQFTHGDRWIVNWAKPHGFSQEGME